MKLIDLTHEIESGMPVYPGDMKTSLYQSHTLDKDHYNNHRLEISMHAGTHVDSPMHLTRREEYISEWPLESFVGTGCVLDVRGQSLITMKDEYEALVAEGSIVLLYTGYDSLYGTKEYYEDCPSVDTTLCRFLISKKIKLLGMDMPSPDHYPFEIHQLLFRNNICVLENLTHLEGLTKVERFEVMALPLKLRADSSMVRAVARIL